MSRRWVLRWAAAPYLAVAVGAGGVVGVTCAPEPAPPAEQVCHEDQPCWDCTTMGNLICGPGVAR